VAKRARLLIARGFERLDVVAHTVASRVRLIHPGRTTTPEGWFVWMDTWSVGFHGYTEANVHNSTGRGKQKSADSVEKVGPSKLPAY